MTEFRAAYIAGSSVCASDYRDLVNGEFDVVVLSSSWDARCLSVECLRGLSVDSGVLFLFSQRDDIGLRDAHDRRMLTFVEGIADRAIILNGDSRELKSLWSDLCGSLSEVRVRLQRTVRVLVDLSCMPRYLSLGLLSFAFNADVAHEIVYLYAEGSYPESDAVTDPTEIFTRGGWEAVPIPGCEGLWDPDKPWEYYVSVGFEGNKILRIISREEPTSVRLLIPDPPVDPRYRAITEAETAPLCERFGIDIRSQLRAHAADAIDAWKQIVHARADSRDESNIAFVCCGTKPHSLGLALAGLVFRNSAVHYMVPDHHKPTKTVPNGVFWSYRITDTSAYESAGR